MKKFVLVLLVFLLSACSSNTKTQESDITNENINEVIEVLKESDINNVDIFEKWVNRYLSNTQEETEGSGFNDADCRMTVMLLVGDSISYDSLKDNYDGTYLMFDLDVINNEEDFKVLKDKEQLFYTLFGETEIDEDGYLNAYPNNLKKYGIKFNSNNFSVINLVLKAYEEEKAFVGHTGLLINCEDIDAVDTKYLYIEKIAFNDVYKTIKVNDEKELLDILAERGDYASDDDNYKTLVYKDEEFLGELYYKGE